MEEASRHRTGPPTHTPQKEKITQNFRTPTQSGRQRKRKQAMETPKFKKKKNKTKHTPQRQISTYFNGTAPEPLQLPTTTTSFVAPPLDERRFAASGPRQSLRIHRQKLQPTQTQPQTTTPRKPKQNPSLNPNHQNNTSLQPNSNPIK